MVGVSNAEPPLVIVPSSAAQELSVSAMVIIGAVAPVAIALFFTTKVIYFVSPAAT